MRRKAIAFIALILALSIFFPLCVSASNGITNIDEFESISDGDGQYLKYRDNYHLDIKELGLIEKYDGMTNIIANIFFGFSRMLSYLALVLFYHCFSFDIVNLLGGHIDSLMLGLKKVIFDGFFLLAFATSAFFIIKQLYRLNIQQLLGEIAKVLLIVVISFAMVKDSNAFLSQVNNITKQVAVEALGAFSGTTMSNDDGSLSGYAADAAGILWGGLVHKPWVALEFGNDYDADDEDINKILPNKVGSDERKETVKELNENEGLFEANVGDGRVWFTLFISFPILIKCAFYILIAFFQLAFQLLTLFYVLTCPIILVMAISPSLGGMDLIWKWLKKIMETQVSVLILTFIIGLVVKFDALLFNTNQYGWVIGLWMQVGIIAALIWQRDKVLKFMSGVTRSVQNPNIASRQFMYSGNMYETAPEVARKVANSAKYFLGGQAPRATLTDREGSVGSKNGVATYREENYRNIQQYEPDKPDQGEQAAIANEPSEKLSVPPISNTQDVKQLSASSSADISNENVPKRDNIIYYSKIPRYESKENTGQNTPPDNKELQKRPVSLDIAVNDDTAIPANRNVASYNNGHAAPERPQTAMISTAGMTSNDQNRDTVGHPEKSETTIVSSASHASNIASHAEAVKNNNETDKKPNPTMSNVKAYNYTPPIEPGKNYIDTGNPNKSEAIVKTSAANATNRTESIKNNKEAGKKSNPTMSNVKAYDHSQTAAAPAGKETNTANPKKSNQAGYTPVKYSKLESVQRPQTSAPASEDTNTANPKKSTQSSYTPINYSAIITGKEQKPVNDQSSQSVTKPKAPAKTENTQQQNPVNNNQSRQPTSKKVLTDNVYSPIISQNKQTSNKPGTATIKTEGPKYPRKTPDKASERNSKTVSSKSKSVAQNSKPASTPKPVAKESSSYKDNKK